MPGAGTASRALHVSVLNADLATALLIDMPLEAIMLKIIRPLCRIVTWRAENERPSVSRSTAMSMSRRASPARRK